jgi:hypothetical protein
MLRFSGRRLGEIGDPNLTRGGRGGFQRTSRAREVLGRVGLVAASLLLTLGVLELGCRVTRGMHWLVDWPNLAVHEDSPPPPALFFRKVYDPALGYAPSPDYRSPRQNIAADAAPILVGGDSYAFGQEAADDETWPAYLQSLLGRRTVNAGVPAYGLDQSVLRVEREAAAVKPSLIVIDFIGDDLWRSEFHRLWGLEKPYFTASGADALTLNNVPVPRLDAKDDGYSSWQRAFGWSVLLDLVASHTGLQDDWIGNNKRAMPAGRGEQVGCLLMARLARIGVPTLVVAQYTPALWAPNAAPTMTEQRRAIRHVLGCAEKAGLMTLDTYDVVARVVHDEGVPALYFIFHHNAHGNRIVAGAIAAELARRGVSLDRERPAGRQ